MNFEMLPTGLTIQMALTDSDATAFAADYLKKHDIEIKNLIRQKIGVSLDISDPEIHFGSDELTISAKAGKGFMKVSASAAASVRWDGRNAQVEVKTLSVPVVSIEPAKANSLIQAPIRNFVNELQKSFTIRSFRVEPGRISIDAVKK